ncbi:glycerol-3-phosphate-acyltransferase [Macrolepiota fuliginosa MF-IS2]|uniref:Glycerol-3-phosphate-acyltransferase n=1 Tax=Macrolepiota fuliginosa MF-IS2 TaxID=1400762 RepID=A0A9P6C8Q0_9AGAR|nr:glycerol-3-phosphate-acyltransferase [Macrolepiota fuliginosa MF-IS2]
MSDYKLLHRIIRGTARLAVGSFFTELRVIGGENVPKEGPIIVCATHHNMMLDPVILSVGFPYQRILNYWSKATLFGNPVVRWILLSSGNIPVDRKSKDRRVLLKGTLEALAHGEAVALFPEGTSYTEPRIMQVKDGAAWAALEYTKWAHENADKAAAQEVQVIPVAIVYTNKSKYRSGVIMEFGQPIKMDAYKEQFFSSQEGAPRAAVKRLTQAIEKELIEASVNAPDWDTLYAARMARDILWEDKEIGLDEFVVVSQTLVDLFTLADTTPNMKSVRRHLLEYYSLLQSSHLTNATLSSLQLPRSLDPKAPVTLPSRLYTMLILLRDSVSASMRLPFFLFPLVVHAPAYVMARYGAKLVENEEETQAQNKVAFGLIAVLFVYSTAFFFLWALLMYTPIGAVVSAVTVYLFAVYHNQVIDDNYESAKRCIAAWRVVVGVWVPKKWDLSLHALSQYTTPRVPPENPWIDRPKKLPARLSGSDSSDAMNGRSTSVGSQSPDLRHGEEPPVMARPVRRPPSRRLVRHVLRARVEAIRALAAFFEQLERAGADKKVYASAHLAHAYGGIIEQRGEDVEGWRYGREVMEFVRKLGGVIPMREKVVEGEWAALSSEGEGYTTNEEIDK